MNEVIKQWVDALRSGLYKQTTGALRKDERAGAHEGFCCLGVLCDLFAKANPDVAKWVPLSTMLGDEARQQFRVPYSDGYGFTFETAHLPEAVRTWAGLRDNSGEFWDVTDDGDEIETSLACLNDDRLTFEEIADKIEAAPSGLFQ